MAVGKVKGCCKDEAICFHVMGRKGKGAAISSGGLTGTIVDGVTARDCAKSSMGPRIAIALGGVILGRNSSCCLGCDSGNTPKGTTIVMIKANGCAKSTGADFVVGPRGPIVAELHTRKSGIHVA